MSFTTYPILSLGTNIDLIRQGHNLLTEAVGDISGLQTQSTTSLVDAVNSLQIYVDGLTTSAYPTLSNGSWITGFNNGATVALNMFRINSGNELEIGTVLTPALSTLDIGKTGDGFRHLYLLGTAYANSFAPYTGNTLTFTCTSSHIFNLNATSVAITEEDGTTVKLEAAADNLNIRSLRTRLYSGSNYWENSTSGHLLPDGNNTKDVGASATRVRKVWAGEVDVSGASTFNDIEVQDLNVTGTINFPANYGGQVPIGGGFLWFVDTPPPNCVLIQGQVLVRATYPVLFALFGTNYNTGGESGTEFRLPDLRQRIPIGADSSKTSNPDMSAPGKTFGSLNHTHVTVMPRHYHGFGTLTLSTVNLDHSHTGTAGATGLPGLTGHNHSVNDPGHAHNYTDPGHAHAVNRRAQGSGGVSSTELAPGTTGGSGYSSSSAVMNAVTTGISISGSLTNVSLNPTNLDHAHSVTVNNTGLGALTNHSHTLSGVVGQPLGSNGDIDNNLTSGTANPPCFTVHFAIRVQ